MKSFLTVLPDRKTAVYDFVPERIHFLLAPFVPAHAMNLIFKVIDYAASLLMGAATVFFVSLFVNKGWNMAVAMVAGMLFGMIAFSLVTLLFVRVSTFFQIMPPGMIISMFTGMGAGMALSEADFDLALLLKVSAIFSIFVQYTMDLYNLTLSGEVPLGRKKR